MSRRLLFVVNDSAFFVTHRLPVAIAAKSAGFDVIVATASNGRVDEILKAGLKFISIPLERSSRNLLTELRLLAAMILLFRSSKPDIIHLVTIKPVIYGGIISRVLRVKAVVFAISGMGYLFTDGRKGFTRKVVEILYRMALGHRNGKVVIQNEHDRSTLKSIGAIKKGHDVLIPGSGVDLNKYFPTPFNINGRIVILPSRMLWDKGVGEFVEAARILRNRGVNARFVLVGERDEYNPTAISLNQLNAWNDEGVIEWWGYRENMPEIFAMASLVVLPSYREGLPKSLAEAAAAGKAIVTTDAPGCRDVVEHGRNGLLVPVRDAVSLAQAMYELIHDKARLELMGIQSRQIAETKFGLDSVIDKHMSIYNELCKKLEIHE